ncbi:MAG TPA: hypothetical protein DCR04_01240 [Flavobacteriales bacterium]|nr:hypothetical protein [Flavobacteriales bacterium]
MRARASLLFVVLPFMVFCQSTDSLLQRAIYLEYSDPEAAIAITNDLILDGVMDKKALSNVWEVQGIALWVKEDYGQAISAHSESLKLRKEADYKSGIGYSANNLGLNFQSLGDARLAMENFLNAKDVAIAANDSSLLAKVLGNIGTLYEEENDIEKALEFYERSLAILESLDEKRVLGNTLNNVSVVYLNTEQFEKAKAFAKRSLVVRKLIDDEWGIAQSLNLVGLSHVNLRQYKPADNLYNQSLQRYTDLNSPWGQSMVLGNLGKSAVKQEAFSTAINYCKKSLSLAKEHQLEWEESACKCLAEAYGGLGNSNQSSKYWNRVFAIKDSLQKENALTEISLVQKRFEFEKEQLKAQHEIQLLTTEAELADLKLRKRETYLLTAMIVTFLLGIMSLILFFFYRVRTKANVALGKKNNEISAQKEIIEEKNLHITDSIRYAERLQSAILPKDETFAKHFSDFYILYKPKDIVSGDFYWMEEAHGLVFLAAADCTGHGVPGAMVSMVGFQGLNKAVLEEKLTSPAAILQRLSDHVEEAFEKSGGSIKDGMDICLVAIDVKKRQVTYSGAHNALWILTSKDELPNANLREEEAGKRMFELKADRRSIGGFMDAGSFTEKTIELNQGDRLFLFSDGFADQFGGPKGKKLGSKRMRETAREMSVSNNLATLGAIFQDWKGDEEQIDDVTVISVVI